MTERTPEEIFGHHAEVLIKGDIEGILSDYADDAIIVSPSGVRRGKAGVRETFVELLGIVPDADWQVPITVFADDVLFIEWTARSAKATATDGVDTFVFRDGLIRVQTVRFTVQEPSGA
jgi:ketosteroid isomerase-like protein